MNGSVHTRIQRGTNQKLTTWHHKKKSYTNSHHFLMLWYINLWKNRHKTWCPANQQWQYEWCSPENIKDDMKIQLIFQPVFVTGCRSSLLSSPCYAAHTCHLFFHICKWKIYFCIHIYIYIYISGMRSNKFTVFKYKYFS